MLHQIEEERVFAPFRKLDARGQKKNMTNRCSHKSLAGAAPIAAAAEKNDRGYSFVCPKRLISHHIEPDRDRTEERQLQRHQPPLVHILVSIKRRSSTTSALVTHTHSGESKPIGEGRSSIRASTATIRDHHHQKISCGRRDSNQRIDSGWRSGIR